MSKIASQDAPAKPAFEPVHAMIGPTGQPIVPRQTVNVSFDPHAPATAWRNFSECSTACRCTEAFWLVLQVRRIMSRVPTKLKSEEKKGQVEAVTKTKKSRRGIILVPLAFEALQQHREQQSGAKKKAGDRWVERDLVFFTSIGTPLNTD